MINYILSCFFLVHSVPFHLVKAAEDVASSEYGVLVVEEGAEGERHERTLNPDNDHLFCVIYYPTLHNLSSGEGPFQRYPLSSLLDLGETNVCPDGDDLDDLGLDGKFGYITTNSSVGNCSIAERARRLENAGAQGIISDKIVKNKYNGSDYTLSIEVLTLVEKNAKARMFKYQENSPKSNFYMYSIADSEKSFDLSLVLILLMAVSTVMLGSLWSGYAKQALRQRKARVKAAQGESEEAGGEVQAQDGSGGGEEELSVQVSPLLVLFFVLCMCSMLVLLYFFFAQLVYLIMAMFCLASSLAMYSCLEPLVMASYQIKWLPIAKLPRVNLYLCVLQLELRQLILLLLSLGTAATWFIFRKQDWSWIIQDLLGIMFSINMLKVLRLPSLKICTYLLSALFFYDIFFVFITPLFMEGGKSVMVEVATGHDSDEQLPMVLKVPHLSRDPARVCYINTYSLLGFGDILVPGLLLSYAHSYDLLADIKCKLYWSITTLAYILGLVATFISLFLMNSAQPALLYLVPFTLIPTILVAWCRGDLTAMWQGDFDKEDDAVDCNVYESEDEDEPVKESEHGGPIESLVEEGLPDQDSSISTPDKDKLLN